RAASHKREYNESNAAEPRVLETRRHTGGTLPGVRASVGIRARFSGLRNRRITINASEARETGTPRCQEIWLPHFVVSCLSSRSRSPEPSPRIELGPRPYQGRMLPLSPRRPIGVPGIEPGATRSQRAHAASTPDPVENSAA